VGFGEHTDIVKYYDGKSRVIRESRNVVWVEPSTQPLVDVQLEGELGKPSQQSPTEKSAQPALMEGHPQPTAPGREPPTQAASQPPAQTQSSQQRAQKLPQSTGEPPRQPSTSLIPPATVEEEKHAPEQTVRRSSRATSNLDYRQLNNPAARPSTSARLAPPPNETPEERGIDSTDTALLGESILEVNGAPRSYNEALKSAEQLEWKQAMREEIEMMKEKGTYQLVELPKDREAIGCKWTYVKKVDELGRVSRYKARLVALGCSQIPGVDFTETFAPVVRLESIRAALAIAAIENLEIIQMDIRGAYLNGELKEEIYMRQPPGFEDETQRVWRLRKTIYGLKQSGREWNREFDSKLTSIHLNKTAVDHCVYFRERDGERTWITVWVDDLLILSTTRQEAERTREEIEKLFETKDLGEPRKIIGIEIKRDRQSGTISLSQRHYIESLLVKYGLADAKPLTTPMDPNVTLRKTPADAPPAPADLRAQYQSMIGGLMYAAICTRPDIAYAVTALSQYSSNPGPEHWSACKRVFRYLSGTKNYGLVYGGTGDNDNVSVGYSDADYAANPDDRKSISGYAFMLGRATYGWSSKKQSTVATSSTEAEYTALAHATRFAVWSRNLLGEMGVTQAKATVIFEDNQAALALARDPQFHARSKHFDVQNHFIREKIENSTIEPIYCSTDDQLADIFTKPLARPKHEKFTRGLGLLPV
jgi:hypothetical protein